LSIAFGVVFVTRPPASELRRRLPRLALGLVAFGVGIALLVFADLGLGPWDVLHQGLADVVDLPIGTVGILVGLVVLAGWLPLRQRMGIGTVANVLGVGAVIDLVLWALPSVTSLWVRVPSAAAGVVLMGLGCATYIGAGLGPGPRDGLMVGLHERGWGSVRSVRTGIELCALALGWALGGTVGVFTVVQAVTIGPLVQLFLPRATVAALEETPVTAR
jgi:uncharacterized membrane protein YczE